jgi:hypothetical protein
MTPAISISQSIACCHKLHERHVPLRQPLRPRLQPSPHTTSSAAKPVISDTLQRYSGRSVSLLLHYLLTERSCCFFPCTRLPLPNSSAGETRLLAGQLAGSRCKARVRSCHTQARMLCYFVNRIWPLRETRHRAGTAALSALGCYLSSPDIERQRWNSCFGRDCIACPH